MNLPPELFQATMIALRASIGPTASEIESRVEPRRKLMGSATIIPCSLRSGRKPVTVGICDLSESGIGVVHNRPIRVGEEFILAIPSVGDQPKRAALFQVEHYQPLNDGGFRMGASFVRELRAVGIEPGKPDEMNPLNSRPAPNPKMPVESLGAVFRSQAVSGLTPEEVERLRELENRLANALEN